MAPSRLIRLPGNELFAAWTFWLESQLIFTDHNALLFTTMVSLVQEIARSMLMRSAIRFLARLGMHLATSSEDSVLGRWTWHCDEIFRSTRDSNCSFERRRLTSLIILISA